MLKLQREGRQKTLTSTEMLVTVGDQNLILEIHSSLEEIFMFEGVQI